SPSEAAELTKAMLGSKLVTAQTGPEGKTVNKVYIEAGCDIAKEYYLGMLLDRAVSRVVVMASAEGGMDIEKVAHETPEKIHKVWVDPAVGLQPFQARQLAYALNLEGATARDFGKFAQALYRCYTEIDATLVEINPLVVTKAGAVVALDGKLNLDDNAMFRHKTARHFIEAFKKLVHSLCGYP
ncbi:hypothetical protein IID22_01740, partial [Patescibacteria group bacterium]|nr:hypothetical protein [Patescibacteria group bacterium]